MRTGIGFDVHKLVSGRPLMLGGIEIEHEKGLAGHSDADVLVHAIMDSILGAAGLGDIGLHFPDDDPQYKDISSLELLERVGGLIKEKGFLILNIDSVVIAERPKISTYFSDMEKILSKTLKIDKISINIKATTTEGMGFCGRGEGIAAQAITLIEKK